MKPRGCFITIEGGDGTGKSTLVAGLEARFREMGRKVHVTREPGGTDLAEEVRRLVLTPPHGSSWSGLGQTLLVYGARRDHLEKLIIPALEAGDIVISDRFSDSTRVYQGLGGVDRATIDALDLIVVGSTQPDLTLILDGPVSELLARREGRGVSDVFEAQSLDYHEKVRSAYLDIARSNPDRCKLLDALMPPDEIIGQAMSLVDRVLAHHG